MPIELVMDPVIRNLTITIQLIGGVVIIFSLIIALKQYRLQKKEVIEQNNKIIILLEKILQGVKK